MNNGDKITIIVLALVIIVVAVFYLIGSWLPIGKTCFEIDDISGCEHCYTPCVTSNCSNSVAEHNAIVDTIVCACENVSSSGYSNSYLNNQIVSFYNQRISSVHANNVRDVCESNVLVKWL